MLLLPFLGCARPPEGLRLTPHGDGPTVRVDWDAVPLPDIPFPNDLATRPDPTSPTGLRLNLPLDAPVAEDARGRAELDTLSGFGIDAPITVAFEAPLDVQNLVDRQKDDAGDPDSFLDDAVFLVDVDPRSPDFGELVPLDFDSGRYTEDLTQLDALMPNDPRASEPSLIFETAEEDHNNNERLDPGEDSDGDGLLDHPNVWPPGGDHRLDLLTFYDRQSSTLILRPVVPLREETTYAVVLTQDLLGADGDPVRSPWEWVNHTAQTDALRPVVRALGQADRHLDDIAFAWTFTTGQVTQDLRSLVEGLNGKGPFHWLADAYPATVTEAHELHDATIPADPLVLPVEALMPTLKTVVGGYLGGSLDVMIDAYEQFADAIVGGAYVTPDLLVDRDDGGLDDSDEHWDLDPSTGELVAAPRRVVFTCVLPKETAENKPPWPIAIHSHGYGTFRLEFVAFAYAELRHGIAVCGIDAPGHGIDLDPETTDLLAGLLQATGTSALWYHLLDDRKRDLDNDGVPDVGGDTFSADPFHTRDMLRQGVLDQAQLIRTLKACGTGSSTMERVTPRQTGLYHSRDQVADCDWNGDGEPDLGGPDTKFYVEGVSMGGIMSAMSIAVNDATTGVLTVPGGGLGDVGLRTEMGSVQKPMAGRAVSPVIYGEPDGAGGLAIDQAVVSVDDEVTLPIGHLDVFPPGGTVVVRNLALGIDASGPIPVDGRFQVPIAANAMDPAEKRVAAGIPIPADPTATYEVPGNDGLGDPLVVEVHDADGALVATFDRFDGAVVHEGVTMAAGSPLVAGSWGLGYRRGSTDLRRLVGALAMGIEGADPIAYARRWDDDPYDQPKNVLIHLTVGDTTVPEATGIALARADGIVDFRHVDPRYGTTADRWLIDHGVVRGLEETGPYVGPNGDAILFDPDDLDEGTDGTGAPSEAPLRAQRPDRAGGVHGLRFLYVDPHGVHAYTTPDESLPFDWPLFGAQQMAEFLASDGSVIDDDPCLATRECPYLPTIATAGE